MPAQTAFPSAPACALNWTLVPTCAALCQTPLKRSQNCLSTVCVNAGRETLFEEDLEEGEVEAELAPLAAQAAHVAGRAGRVTEAVAAYQVHHPGCCVNMRGPMHRAV